MKTYLIFTLCILAFTTETYAQTKEGKNDMKHKPEQARAKTEEEWKKLLTPLQYHVTREKGTEPLYTGIYDRHFTKGSYVCVACGNLLFTSATKYQSGCGWPAFNDVADKNRFRLREDLSHGMIRTEVVCATCGAHLGHVFHDDPPPTGLRYCINSAAPDFIPEDSGEK